MKKIILSIIAVVITLSITGCGGATPQAVNGKYYMMGDSNCKRYTVMDSNRIMCYTSDSKKVGWRASMTDQEISMYQHNQQIAQQQSAQTQQSLNNLNNQLQRQNEQMNYNTQQMMNRNNVYKFQQVGPYGY